MAQHETDQNSIEAAASGVYVLLDNSLADDGACTLFESPVEIVRCEAPDEVERALERIAQAGSEGLHAAGFLSYELGYLMEPKLRCLLPAERPQPLIWMGLFPEGRRLTGKEARRWIEGRRNSGYEITDWQLSWDKATYLKAFQKVKDYIVAGDVYQINLTLKYLFNFSGDPLSLYSELRRKQRVNYGAVIQGEDFHLLSLSPELFLRSEQGCASARPMKGTAPRGRTPDEDAALKDWLQGDEKSRAENLMIVDLLRNDLGRAAEIGSVAVTDLFTVERYPTLHQMTSGITARLRPGMPFRELLGGLFPCGSITGAPKVRAMEIIRELEAAPRGIYTGAIGAVKPGGDLIFNVAIRSLYLNDQGRGEMGIGSGVVYDSDGTAEYAECLLKADFLTTPFRPFKLIETLRWAEGGYYLLAHHLDRLEASAARFHFVCDRAKVAKALEVAAEGYSGSVFRVRLLLDEDGETVITASPIELPDSDSEYRFVISEKPTDSGDPFFYHKTTKRELYDSEFGRLQAESGCDEVLFLNERGELAEGSRSTLFIERDGALLTPPLSAGILNGTLRRALLESPERRVEECTLWPADLETAERIYFGNSVRGLVPAHPL
jgi:para-aminobenzoate synthetase/4-amino-4-deoxychorismate lyase